MILRIEGGSGYKESSTQTPEQQKETIHHITQQELKSLKFELVHAGQNLGRLIKEKNLTNLNINNFWDKAARIKDLDGKIYQLWKNDQFTITDNGDLIIKRNGITKVNVNLYDHFGIEGIQSTNNKQPKSTLSSHEALQVLSGKSEKDKLTEENEETGENPKEKILDCEHTSYSQLQDELKNLATKGKGYTVVLKQGKSKTLFEFERGTSNTIWVNNFTGAKVKYSSIQAVWETQPYSANKDTDEAYKILGSIERLDECIAYMHGKPSIIDYLNQEKAIMEESMSGKMVPNLRTKGDVIQYQTNKIVANIIEDTQGAQNHSDEKEKKHTEKIDPLARYEKMSIEERFEAYTVDVGNGYLRLDFPNKAVEYRAKIDEIIPEKYLYLELVKHKEKRIHNPGGKNHRAPIKSNYFDIIARSSSDESFSSIFQGNIYSKKPTILEGNLIKLGTENKPIDLSYSGITATTIEDGIDHHNEKVIRSLYGRKITQWVRQINTPGITEAFVYSIIKQESGFNPNAKSFTHTRGIMQITLPTLGSILADESNLVGLDDTMPVMDRGAKYGKDRRGNMRLLNVGTRPYHPELGLKAGISYLGKLGKIFQDAYQKNPSFFRDLVSASYNAGFGIIQKAYEKSINGKYPNSLDDLVLRLQKMKEEGEISQEKYNEVIHYVNRVAMNHYNIKVAQNERRFNSIKKRS